MENTDVNEGTTLDQDVPSTEVEAVTEESLLADILSASPMLSEEEKGSLPNTEEDQGDTDEYESEDLTEEYESDEDVEEDTDDIDEEYEDEDAGEEEDEEDLDEETEESDEEPANPDIEILEEDEVEWETQIPVTIDGETAHVTLAELRKGYATEQHLSKKGREIGEAKKAVEEERETKLNEVVALSESMNEMLGSAEQSLAQEYHELEAKIQEARDDGDTYALSELKDKREIVQSKYWTARNQREKLGEQVAAQQEAARIEEWNGKVEQFYTDIKEAIPSYDDKHAALLRDFGKEEGLSDEFMTTVTDATVVKVLDDYRRLKATVAEGARKRKKAPTRKAAAPTKKSVPAAKKKADQAKMRKARAFRDDATDADRMDFLKDYAANSLAGRGQK